MMATPTARSLADSVPEGLQVASVLHESPSCKIKEAVVVGDNTRRFWLYRYPCSALLSLQSSSHLLSILDSLKTGINGVQPVLDHFNDDLAIYLLCQEMPQHPFESAEPVEADSLHLELVDRVNHLHKHGLYHGNIRPEAIRRGDTGLVLTVPKIIEDVVNSCTETDLRKARTRDLEDVARTFLSVTTDTPFSAMIGDEARHLRYLLPLAPHLTSRLAETLGVLLQESPPEVETSNELFYELLDALTPLPPPAVVQNREQTEEVEVRTATVPLEPHTELLVAGGRPNPIPPQPTRRKWLRWVLGAGVSAAAGGSAYYATLAKPDVSAFRALVEAEHFPDQDASSPSAYELYTRARRDGQSSLVRAMEEVAVPKLCQWSDKKTAEWERNYGFEYEPNYWNKAEQSHQWIVSMRESPVYSARLHFTTGMKLLDETTGGAQDAGVRFKDCIALQPLMGLARISLARVHRRNGEIDKARLLLSDITDTQPKWGPPWRALADILLNGQANTPSADRAQALGALQKAIQINPDDFIAMDLLSAYLNDRKQTCTLVAKALSVIQEKYPRQSQSRVAIRLRGRVCPPP